MVDVLQQPALERSGSSNRPLAVMAVIGLAVVALMTGAWGWLLIALIAFIALVPAVLGLLSPRAGWMFFGRGRPPEHVPVQLIVLEGPTGRRTTRAEGHLNGAASVGDRLQVWGRWHGGLLHLRRAYNLTTEHALSVRHGSFADGIYAWVAIGAAGIAALLILREVTG